MLQTYVCFLCYHPCSVSCYCECFILCQRQCFCVTVRVTVGVTFHVAYNKLRLKQITRGLLQSLLKDIPPPRVPGNIINTLVDNHPAGTKIVTFLVFTLEIITHCEEENVKKTIRTLVCGWG